MINFFSESISFALPDQEQYALWIAKVVAIHKKKIEDINFIFCSDDYLLELNKKFLNHHYLTDILTFPHHELPTLPLSADIYISIDRVKENADSLKILFNDELDRVMIHGILHLIGFDDHSISDKKEMKDAENNALSMRE